MVQPEMNFPPTWDDNRGKRDDFKNEMEQSITLVGRK